MTRKTLLGSRKAVELSTRLASWAAVPGEEREHDKVHLQYPAAAPPVKSFRFRSAPVSEEGYGAVPLHSDQCSGLYNGQQSGQILASTRPGQWPVQWTTCGQYNGNYTGQYNGKYSGQYNSTIASTVTGTMASTVARYSQ